MPEALPGNEVRMTPLIPSLDWPGWLQQTVFVRAPTSPPAATLPVPAAYWKFDGDLTDASGNGRDLTGGSESYVTGRTGQAMAGAGTRTNDVLPTGNINSASWTVGFWQQKQPEFATRFTTIRLKNDASPFAQITLSIGIHIAGFELYTATVGEADTGTSVSANPSPAPTLGAGWHLYVLVCDAGQLTLYVDGAAVATADATTLAAQVFDPAGAWTVSGDAGAKGQIDDAAIWGVALTGPQVAAWYAAAGDLSTILDA